MLCTCQSKVFCVLQPYLVRIDIKTFLPLGSWEEEFLKEKMSSNFKGEFGSMKRARKVPLKLRSPEPVPPKKRAKKTTTTTITTADDDDRKCRRRRQNRNPNGNARRRNTGANARKTTAIHVVARNEDGGKREEEAEAEEENAGVGTNLLGFLIEATDCASPVTTDKR